MRSPLYIDREFRRVWLYGWRVHHGFVGLALTAVGVALMAHDFKDRWAWIHTELTELI